MTMDDLIAWLDSDDDDFANNSHVQLASSSSQCANKNPEGERDAGANKNPEGESDAEGTQEDKERTQRERDTQLLLQRMQEEQKKETAEQEEIEREYEEEEKERKRKRRAKETLLRNAWEDEKSECLGLPISFWGDGSGDDDAVLQELNFIAGQAGSHYVGGAMNVLRRWLAVGFGHSHKWPQMTVLAVRLGGEGAALESLAINFALDNILGCTNKARDARGLCKANGTINFLYVCHSQDKPDNNLQLFP